MLAKRSKVKGTPAPAYISKKSSTASPCNTGVTLDATSLILRFELC